MSEEANTAPLARRETHWFVRWVKWCWRDPLVQLAAGLVKGAAIIESVILVLKAIFAYGSHFAAQLPAAPADQTLPLVNLPPETMIRLLDGVILVSMFVTYFAFELASYCLKMWRLFQTQHRARGDQEQ